MTEKMVDMGPAPEKVKAAGEGNAEEKNEQIDQDNHDTTDNAEEDRLKKTDIVDGNDRMPKENQ